MSPDPEIADEPVAALTQEDYLPGAEHAEQLPAPEGELAAAADYTATDDPPEIDPDEPVITDVEIALLNGSTQARIDAFRAREIEYRTSLLPASLWAQAVGDRAPTRAQQIAAGLAPNAPLLWLYYECYLILGLEEIAYPEGARPS